MMFVIIATNNTHSTTISVDILQGSIILNLLKFWHSLVIFATKATHCKVFKLLGNISYAIMYQILVLLPKASFDNTTYFVCYFCTGTFGFVERMKNHIHCRHASETIIKGKLWY